MNKKSSRKIRHQTCRVTDNVIDRWTDIETVYRQRKKLISTQSYRMAEHTKTLATQKDKMQDRKSWKLVAKMSGAIL